MTGSSLACQAIFSPAQKRAVALFNLQHYSALRARTVPDIPVPTPGTTYIRFAGDRLNQTFTGGRVCNQYILYAAAAIVVPVVWYLSMHGCLCPMIEQLTPPPW